MRSIYLIRVLLVMCAIALAAGCSKNLDLATAQPVIDQWIQQQTIGVIVNPGSTSLECGRGLYNSGYIKVIGHRTFNGAEIIESTEKIPKDKTVDKGWIKLPLFKAQLLAVSPVNQVQGEKHAVVNFSYKYVPRNPDIPEICNQFGSQGVITKYAQFTLTTNGWVGKVPKQL